jgi:SET domain-containing protein
MAERSIALPPRCGCTGANRRTWLIWPATELSVSAVPARAWVFATAPIRKRAFIVEYKGRKLTTEQADKLEARGNRYLFEINSRWTIDGTSRKNLGRYANHSCRPNAEIHTIGHKVIIRAIKNIRTGAEITYNYGRDYLTNVITRRGCKCDKCRTKRADARAKARAKSRRAHDSDA